MAMADQYDAFASDYDWVFANFGEAGQGYVEGVSATIGSELPPDPLILDCACGTGVAAIALAKHGYRVVGTDASEGMIARARQHAAADGLGVEFMVCRWDALGEQVRRQFDLAFCCGNSIGHCRNEEEMIRSLRGIHDALKPRGKLVVGNRNWERILAKRNRFTTLGLRQQGVKRCVPLYVWTFGQTPGEPTVVEVVLPIEANGKVTLASYPVQYYPFRVEELMERLSAAGFVDMKTDWAPDKGHYKVACRASN